ncbi:MAG: hypothetical protein AAGA48_40445 [Myxococcota bacterium]
MLLLSFLGCATRSPVTPAPAPLSTSITVTYAGPVPQEARPVIEEAANRWATLLVTSVPIRIRVTFFEGNGPQGFARPHLVRDFEGAPFPGIDYPTALADALVGRDLHPGVDDMNVFFKVTDEWHFTGPVPPDRPDFLTVVMHEFGHGFGFTTSAFLPWEGDPIASMGLPNEYLDFFEWSFPPSELDGTVTVFDALVRDAQGRSIADRTVFPNPSPDLYQALAGPLSFHGATTVAVYGKPLPLDPRSVSHLSREAVQETSPDWQMVPDTGRGVRQPSPGPLMCAVLLDLGWTLRE